MTNLGLKEELRDGETIRAYLEELARLKTPVQFWLAQADEIPFETTLEGLRGDNFCTTQTPLLVEGQLLSFSFMLDTRRFISYTRVVTTGVFSIPQSVAQGERRDRLRATFERGDRSEVLAVEQLSDTIFGGRFLMGRLLDLSLQGLRVSLDDTGSLTGPNPPLKRGDTFANLCINNLPYTPTIHCSGIVAHIAHSSAGTSCGFLLNDLTEGAQKNIERILSRRFPATFGQAFPSRKRKTDVADRRGAPTKTQVLVKPPEVVERPVEKPVAPAPRPERPNITAVMRLRKLGKKILFLSANLDSSPILAQAFREDGFKQVAEARTFLDAQNLAKRQRFDLVLLDVKVGGHWGKDMIGALRSHNLLLETPIILVADNRTEGAVDVAASLHAVHIHERRESYEDLVPLVYALLLEENPG